MKSSLRIEDSSNGVNGGSVTGCEQSEDCPEIVLAKLPNWTAVAAREQIEDPPIGQAGSWWVCPYLSTLLCYISLLSG